MFSLVSLCLLSFGVQIAYEDKSIVIKVQTNKDIKVQDNIIDILYLSHVFEVILHLMFQVVHIGR